VDDFHRQLGLIMWDYCGMARNNAGLEKARAMIQDLRAEFWDNVRVPGGGKTSTRAWSVPAVWPIFSNSVN
jgi:succinate dehydrogenase/fumarate reductase flavoprotein subunit